VFVCDFILFYVAIGLFFKRIHCKEKKEQPTEGVQKSVQPNLLLVFYNSRLLFAIMQYLFGYCFAAQKLLYSLFRKSYLMLLPT
jgi:hypothetical protein